MQTHETNLDEAQLAELCEDLADAFPGFVDSFLACCHRLPGELAADVERCDLAQAGSRAHQAKGTAGYLGAVKLAARLGRLQHAAEAGDADRVRSEATLVAAAIEELVPRLNARLGRA